MIRPGLRGRPRPRGRGRGSWVPWRGARAILLSCHICSGGAREERFGGVEFLYSVRAARRHLGGGRRVQAALPRLQPRRAEEETAAIAAGGETALPLRVGREGGGIHIFALRGEASARPADPVKGEDPVPPPADAGEPGPR